MSKKHTSRDTGDCDLNVTPETMDEHIQNMFVQPYLSATHSNKHAMAVEALRVVRVESVDILTEAIHQQRVRLDTQEKVLKIITNILKA